jgi:hypothetical protein
MEPIEIMEYLILYSLKVVLSIELIHKVPKRYEANEVLKIVFCFINLIQKIREKKRWLLINLTKVIFIPLGVALELQLQIHHIHATL